MSYVWMPNHTHLLLKTPQPTDPLSSLAVAGRGVAAGNRCRGKEMADSTYYATVKFGGCHLYVPN
jgi:REP element-mobilizing transposase RayT